MIGYLIATSTALAAAALMSTVAMVVAMIAYAVWEARQKILDEITNRHDRGNDV